MISLKYTKNQIELLWNAVAYNTQREFAFMTEQKQWFHPKCFFRDSDELYEYVVQRNLADIHVKALDNGVGREWVIDVDFKDETTSMLNLKIDIATAACVDFFGRNNISRIMHSGNRGIHVWLRIDKFRMSANKNFRERYFKVFVPPKQICIDKIRQGSFAYSVRQGLLKYQKSIQLQMNMDDDNVFNRRLAELMLLFWPLVDKHVFCNLNQIRAPYSFNCKGNKFSHQLY
ncbi:Late expression factor 1 [Perigonia lusca single nucleopolyhedrovirus]|uniref:Late expression factor 1 n=1 Tax=Perigonia lusca single nucleopolyhedrovirus TaxID=1675865 RepID=A0A0M3N1Z2_9ABAC|nr:Late expression factor 1 [Perigonia lusca single nucleopolyhedrovirus]AKN80614.1 Late expression factor 1 [Perigonia lusca single nucleopolyhedrovirus]